jgi:peptidoglycan/LPS O-acetylase OafA/YrhL
VRAAAPAPLPGVPQTKSAGAGHLPSLDGLRAVSIGFVLLGHLRATRGFVGFDLGIGDYGHLGVVVFFVISGFLITRLLLAEHMKTGSVSLTRFYARRSLRLFPAAYTYIACVALLWMAGTVQLERGDIWHAVTYTMNYQPGRSWEFGHLWSLSVEEQFYLLWPCTFILFGLRRISWIAAGVILFGPVARVCAWLFLKETPYYDLPMFPMVADSIATGCLLAKISGWLEGQGWYVRLFRPAYSVGLLALILLINRYTDRTVVSVFGTSIINVSLAILIHRCLYFPRDWIGQVLNWKPVAFAGVLSYSLYLWQQPFLNRSSTAWFAAFPQNLALAIAAALASYLLLERPVLKLRSRLRR